MLFDSLFKQLIHHSKILGDNMNLKKGFIRVIATAGVVGATVVVANVLNHSLAVEFYNGHIMM